MEKAGISPNGRPGAAIDNKLFESEASAYLDDSEDFRGYSKKQQQRELEDWERSRRGS
jgi:hypothetical protein